MIAIISDIHGNLPALRAVLNKIDQLECNKIISLGDIAGYYMQVGQCIDLLRDRNIEYLLGNHDEYIIKDTTCPRSRTVSMLIEYQKHLISEEHKNWLSSAKISYNFGDNYFVHGGWSDPIDEYLYKISESVLPKKGKRFFSGHTHVQKIIHIGDKIYCNPGSVGQPRDGDPRAAFATLCGDIIELYRVEYDIDEIANVMKKAGFESRLWENLYYGTQIGGRIDDIIV